MSSPSPATALTRFEFNAAIQFCNLSYKKKDNSLSYSEFKAQVLSEHEEILNGLGVKDKTLPYITYIDERIRVIATNIGNVVFICITGTNSFTEHTTNLAFHAQRIVQNVPDADAPSMYVQDANNLGIIPLARAMLDAENIEKVILCGHSRGGSVAHVAHYNLISNPNYAIDSTKLTSVAFGSTPFLRSLKNGNEPDERFITYFNSQDIVPALFSDKVAESVLQKLQADHSTKLNVFCGIVGVDVRDALGSLTQVLKNSISEYGYYGRWIKLWHQKVAVEGFDNQTHYEDIYHSENCTNPSLYFASDEFEKSKSSDDIVFHHGMTTAYLAYKKETVVIPTFTLQDAEKMNYYLKNAAAKCIVYNEMSSTMLPRLFNRAIAAAVVTKSFGNNDIFNALVEFCNKLKIYRTTVHEMIKSTNNDHDVASETEYDMKGWNDLLARLKEIKSREEYGENVPENWNTFNDTNISTHMNELSLITSALLAENHLIEEKKSSILSYVIPVGMGIAGIIGAGLAVAAMVEMYAVAGAVEIGLITYRALARAFRGVDSSSPELGLRLRLESYQEASDNYTRQLKNMAKAASISCEDTSNEVVNENVLCGANCVQFANDKNENLWVKYVDVIKEIAKLRELCNHLVFIVVNGKQCVGKSWFIESINQKQHGDRHSTDYPLFYPYKPHASCDDKRQVYLVDLPGHDSLRDNLRQYVKELFGIGSIGINLFQFDVRPQKLDDELRQMQRMFNGCDDVLICLNKVFSVPLSMSATSNGNRALDPILQTWANYFEENAINVSGVNTKYQLMATDMAGTNDLPPVPQGDEEMDRILSQAHDIRVSRNLTTLRANGGKIREDVINWIEAKLQQHFDQSTTENM